MGISLAYRHRDEDEPNRVRENKMGNPNPRNYRIISQKRMGLALILEVEYPDCNNFEGKKILFFYNESLDDVLDQGELDPHFKEKGYSPVARFEPTARGKRMALALAFSLREGGEGCFGIVPGWDDLSEAEMEEEMIKFISKLRAPK